MPRRTDLIGGLIAIALLGGCAVEPASPPEGAAMLPAQVRHELLDRRTTVLGPAWGQEAGRQRLRSWIADADGAAHHHLLVTAAYRTTGWRYYEAATAADGAGLPVRVTDRRVGDCAALSWLGCDHTETVEVLLDEALLRAAAQDGLAVTLTAREGSSLRVRVPADYIRHQLDAVTTASSCRPLPCR